MFFAKLQKNADERLYSNKRIFSPPKEMIEEGRGERFKDSEVKVERGKNDFLFCAAW